MKRKLRVLHADDDESFRILVKHVIESDEDLHSRCEFRFVEDGSDAVDYVLGRGAYADRRANPLPHLIILDQRMAKMDGLEALRAIKKGDAARRIPVFLLSTSAQDSLADECIACGGAFCINKPLDFAKLKPMLSMVVRFSIEVLALNSRAHA
jgi:CheY-like chemotaxis protein